MKTKLFPAFLVLALLIPCGFPALRAQTSDSVAIKKIDAAFVASPPITAPGYRKTKQGQPAPWLEVDVTFDHIETDKTGPKVADELTLNYYILLDNAAVTTVNPDGKPTLLTGSVSHADIPFERGLHSAVFISPQTLLRFFDGKIPAVVSQAVKDLGVTISDKSGVIAMDSLRGKPVGGKTWWDDPSPYSQVTGRLLSKDQTPFADLSWDYYIPPKPKTGL